MSALVVKMVQAKKIVGLPVRFDPKLTGIAFARGLWPLKNVVVGPAWFRLSGPEQEATLAHEAGHCRLFHFERRLLLLPFSWCGWAQAIARRHELDADAFAVRAGHGAGMLQLMLRAFSAESLRAQRREAPTPEQLLERKLMPSAADRLRNISRVLQEKHYEAAA